MDKNLDFQKIFRFLENFLIFGKFSDFWKNFRFLEKFQIFGGFSDFLKVFGRFSDFWETTTATKTILGLVTFETLITILTIEKLNS